MSEKKKSGCFGKLLKCLLWCIVGVLALAVVIVASMPLWISPVATGVANSVAPKITGTDFRIERFYVNPWTGAVRINGVKLSNPEGFGEAPAFSMKSLALDLALLELFANRLHIKELIIDDTFVSYYSHDGVNNIDAILANVEKALGSKEKKKAEKEVEEKVEESKMKVIIDHLNISGTKIKLMENNVIPPMPIFIPELRDIGKESDGSSFEEVWQTLTDSFMKGMGSVGSGLGSLGGMIGDGAKSLTGAVGDGAKSLTSALGGAASSTGDGAKAAAGAAKDAAKNVASGAVEATKDAAGAVGDGAKEAASGAIDATKNAASAVGDGAKAAAEAVGDTAKKAAEGVKNLFRGSDKKESGK